MPDVKNLDLQSRTSSQPAEQLTSVEAWGLIPAEARHIIPAFWPRGVLSQI